jgi:hypothetical protein
VYDSRTLQTDTQNPDAADIVVFSNNVVTYSDTIVALIAKNIYIQANTISNMFTQTASPKVLISWGENVYFTDNSLYNIHDNTSKLVYSNEKDTEMHATVMRNKVYNCTIDELWVMTQESQFPGNTYILFQANTFENITTKRNMIYSKPITFNLNTVSNIVVGYGYAVINVPTQPYGSITRNIFQNPLPQWDLMLTDDTRMKTISVD